MKSTTRRRLTFQLTPLLDLLLIVIFAQYMEVQAKTREEIGEARAAADRAESLADEIDALERRHAAALLKAGNTDERVTLLTDERDRLREDAKRQSERNDRLTKLFTRVFKVNEETLAAAIDPDDPRFEGLSPDDLVRLRTRLDEIVSARGPEALEHLVTYEELRKRADVWRVRVGNLDDRLGLVVIDAGGRTETLTVDEAEEFAEEMARIRNAVEQPKSHVIVLVTYDTRKVENFTLEYVKAGLSRFVTRMNTGDGTRFFWAEIGYDPRVLGLPE